MPGTFKNILVTNQTQLLINQEYFCLLFKDLNGKEEALHSIYSFDKQKLTFRTLTLAVRTATICTECKHRTFNPSLCIRFTK